jgi:hypothetical protein
MELRSAILFNGDRRVFDFEPMTGTIFPEGVGIKSVPWSAFCILF